ncbi:hypothetical protein VAE308_940002 [Vibrio aestuarianus]|uniref:Uncharacterized protein n=2 Tax=Vibrio aestuarianus TaxID=28171 RepID=A0ABM9FLA3_9VIBR|nr:hypothetical protein VAE063_740003 [Vibrio aestuarianus]CAH8235260.1 hypothetical protein VAE308_940002 [Vibrio aestuarianus]
MYAICKKEAVERWLDEEYRKWQPNDGVGEGKWLLGNEERIAKSCLGAFMKGENPFSPMPIDFTREGYIRKLEPAYKCLFSIYRGKRKSHLINDYGKQHTSALDEWLVTTLSGEYIFSESMFKIANGGVSADPKRSNSQTVELMLRVLEIGVIYQFGEVKLCEEHEHPIDRIKN